MPREPDHSEPFDSSSRYRNQTADADLFSEMGRSMTNLLDKSDAANELFSVVVGMIHSVSAKAKQQDVKPDLFSSKSSPLIRSTLCVVMLMEDRYHITIDLDEVPKLKCVSDLTIMLARELRSAAA